MKALRLMIIYI